MPSSLDPTGPTHRAKPRDDNLDGTKPCKRYRMRTEFMRVFRIAMSYKVFGAGDDRGSSVR